MAIVFEGQGTTFTFAGFTLAPKSISIGGWSRTVLDVTNLNNTAVKTKLNAVLREIGEIKLTCEFDPEVYVGIPQGNQICYINFPGITTHRMQFWGMIATEGEVNLETDTQPTFDVTVTVSSLDDAFAEVEPQWVTV